MGGSVDATAPGHGRASQKRRRSPLAALLVIIGALTLMVIVVHVRDGMVAKSDSASYLSVADNLTEGRGLTVPVGLPMHDMTPAEFVEGADQLPVQGYPPLYSLTVGALGAAGLSTRAAAGLVNIASGVGMIVVLALLTWHITARSVVAVSLTVGVVLVQDFFFISMVRYLLPDGMFCFLMLLQIWTAWRYLQDSTRRRFIELVVATAAVVLVRQIGLAMVGSTVLALVLFSPGSGRQRVQRSAAFAGLSLLPMALYLPLTSAGSSGRNGIFDRLAVHLPPDEQYDLVFDTARAWLTGLGGPSWYPLLGGLLVLGLVALAAYGWRLHPPGESVAERRSVAQLAGLLALAGGSYVAVLWITAAFIDADVPLGERYLQPLLLLALPLAAAGLTRFARANPGPSPTRLGWGVVATLAAVALLVLMRGTSTVRYALDLPQSEATTSVGPYLASLPPDAVIFAVDPESVYNDVARAAYVLPTLINRYTLDPSERVESDLAELAALGSTRDVYVVYPLKTNREYVVSLAELQAAVPLEVVHTGREEIVYRVGPVATP